MRFTRVRASRQALAKVPTSGKLGEAETESLVVFPVLADIHRDRHNAVAALAHWLCIEWSVEKVPSTLGEPFDLSADAFAEALRKALPMKRKMTVAEVAAVKKAHADSMTPMVERLTVVAHLERELSAEVNEAHGLTKEEEALVWRTAPPRMPVSPPDRFAVNKAAA